MQVASFTDEGFTVAKQQRDNQKDENKCEKLTILQLCLVAWPLNEIEAGVDLVIDLSVTFDASIQSVLFIAFVFLVRQCSV